MSLRSAWAKLTTHGHPLKGSLQGIFRSAQRWTIPISNGNSISYTSVSKGNAIDGATGHQPSPRIGISNDPPGPAQDSHNGDIEHKICFNRVTGELGGENEGHEGLDLRVDEAKPEHEAAGKATSASLINPSKKKNNKRRKKKKQGLQEPYSEQEPRIEVKATDQGRPLVTAAVIDNLLDAICDPRVGLLGFGAAERNRPKNSKITIDALLDSIPASRVGPAKSISDDHPTGRASEGPVADQDDEVSDNEPHVNIANTPLGWEKKTGSRAYHILRLDNCGSTMIKSDIDRIFSNYHARRVGWSFTVVPARRNLGLQRRNRYYLYFDDDEAAKHHLEHFANLLKSERKSGRSPAATLPPPAAAKTFLESKPPSLDLNSDILRGSAVSVSKYWVPKLFLVNPLQMPLEGVIPAILYQAGGAPGRTVLVSLCAHSHWKALQTWLKYSLIEKHGFGRWLVPGGDNDGCGLERIPIVGPNTPEPSQGGRWVVRFRDGYSSEAERLVRDWDGQWVNILGKWGRLKAEVLW